LTALHTGHQRKA